MVALGRVGIAALCALPGALTLYFAFDGGGFFAAQPGVVAVFLALVLLVWTTMAEHPYAGVSPQLGLAVGAMALYALWTLASGSWSHAPGRALIEFDRALLYVLALVLFGLLVTSSRRLRWIVRGIAVAIVVVCVFGLVTWLFPDSFHVAPNVGRSRLSFPVSYWNTLGLLAAMGIVLCLHLTGSRAESQIARVSAASAIPVLSSTLYFTFSRGAIAVAIVAVAVYCLLTRSKSLVIGFIAILPPTVVAILFAYRADRLSSGNPTSPAAALQGHDLAFIVVTCVVAAGVLRLVLAALESKLLAYRAPPQVRKTGIVVLVALTVASAGLASAVHLPHLLSSEYRRFVGGAAPGTNGDLRTRLLDVSNDGRTDHWIVAFRAFREERFHGQGAGTYQLYWARHRSIPATVRNAHSLYFQVAGELGAVGIALLAVALLTILVGALWRIRSPNRSLYAAVAAVFVAWALRAGVDWDWEMPVVTFVALTLGAGALAGRGRRNPERKPISDGLRMGIALGWLAVAIAPALVTISDGQIARAAEALDHGDCRTARTAALDSIGALGDRAQPYEIVGYCDLRAGFPVAAVGAMRAAVHRDPGNWQYRDGLAVALASADRDPRREARAAVALDPLDDLPRQIEKLFGASRRDRWRAAAVTAREWMFQSGKIGAR